MEYERGMTGMKGNLKHVLEIADTAANPKVKLQARAIANDCYKYLMDLCTNAGIVIIYSIKVRHPEDRAGEHLAKARRENRINRR